MDILSTVPDTVRRLERKLNAAEKARDAKAARIAKLEKDIQEYVLVTILVSDSQLMIS